MKLVVDANVLFASLIKDGKSSELLLDFSFDIFIPEFVFAEFEKHKDEILGKTHRDSEGFWNVYAQVKEVMTMVPKKEFERYLEEAGAICPDPDDIMYLALALKLGCGIWSNDKRLKKQDRIRIYSTQDLAKEFEV